MENYLSSGASRTSARASGSNGTAPLQNLGARLDPAAERRLEKTLRGQGDRIFARAPDEVGQIVAAGRAAVPMLISSMNYVDPGDSLHVACTAVGLGIKIVKTDPAAVDDFIAALQSRPPAAPARYLVDVLDQAEDLRGRTKVEQAMGGLLAEGRRLRQDEATKAEGTMYCKLAISTLGRMGSLKALRDTVDLLDDPSKEIRMSAGTALIHASGRPELSSGKRNRMLAHKILESLKADSPFSAGKVEVLTRGHFTEAVDHYLQAADTAQIAQSFDIRALHYLCNRFFLQKGNFREMVFELLKS
ncbi:MAG: hypothetical protein KGH63_04995, partial [Candidatus Micrarchaeota archaeon]|nr:hypothetical protein [Candidatus Micrarchaeota archaeon]